MMIVYHKNSCLVKIYATATILPNLFRGIARVTYGRVMTEEIKEIIQKVICRKG